MEILYISQFFKPERVAGAFRCYENSKKWNEMGAKVNVLTAYPNFPTGKLFEGYKINLLSKEKVDDIDVLRSKICVKENTSKIKRIVNAISFLFFGSINIIFNSKKIGKNYDVVLGTSGTILTPILAYIYSVINKTPFVLELRDITYIQVLAVYKGKKTILYKLIKMIELFLCKKSKKIIVVTNGFKKELVKAGIDENKIEVIYNGLETKKVKTLTNKTNNELIFSYIGNIGESQNLMEVISIFNKIKINNFEKKLYLIGDGAKKNYIRKYIKDKNISNIFVIDGMEQEELEKYYTMSDFNIVSLKNSKYFKNTIPSKIFQIMGRGKNILFLGPEGEASKIISSVDNSFVFTESDEDEVVIKIEKAINEKIDIKKYLSENSEKFRKMIEKNFDREILSEKYYSILEEVSLENKKRRK